MVVRIAFNRLPGVDDSPALAGVIARSNMRSSACPLKTMRLQSKAEYPGGFLDGPVELRGLRLLLAKQCCQPLHLLLERFAVVLLRLAPT